jgi:hypothetical protein
MNTVIDITVAAPEVGAHAVAVLDRMKILGCIVAQYRQRLKIDDVAVAEPVEIRTRIVSVTSIQPSCITVMSLWNSRMRSSAAASSGAASSTRQASFLTRRIRA